MVLMLSAVKGGFLLHAMRSTSQNDISAISPTLIGTEINHAINGL